MGKKKRAKKGGRAAASVDPAIVAEVAALEQAEDTAALAAVAAGGRPRRDLARKALHRLRQRGVEVPEARRAGPSAGDRVRMAAAQTEDVPTSRVTAPDGTGTAVVWLVRPGGRGGGLRVAQVVVSEKEGVEEIAIHRPSRSEWRRMWMDMGAESDVILAELPAWEVAAWLRPALNDDPASRQARQLVTELREMVASLPDPGDTPPPVYAALGEDVDDGEADGGEDMLDIVPLSTWIPDVPAMEGLLADLEEAEEGVIELTDQQKAERTDRLVDKHVNGWATAAVQARLRRRIEQTARVFAARGEEASARRLLAGVRAMARAETPSATPWIRALVSKWLAPAGAAALADEPGARNPAESLDPSGGDQ